MALSTARIHRVRGRPPLLAAGIRSLIHSHSSSVRSLGYIFSFIYPFYTTHEDFSDRLSALSVTLSPGFFTTASSTSRSLTPMAAPGGLGQLTCALGFVRRRKPRRDRRRLHVGFGPELIGHLEGDPNEVG